MYIRRAKILITVLIVSILLTGCAQHAQLVRDAQDSFSRGAELELSRKFGYSVEGIDNPTEEAERYYAVAFGLANEAINDSTTDLKRDSLYGTILTIKALAAWRLGDWKTAKGTAEDVKNIPATTDGNNKVWPRDRGICNSLVALSEIDALAERAKKFENTKDTEKEKVTLEKILHDGEQTQKELEMAASNSVLIHHPFQFYLAQAHCELAYVLLVATKAGTRLPDEIKNEAKEKYMDVRTKALKRLNEMNQDTKIELPAMAKDKIQRYYIELLEKMN